MKNSTATHVLGLLLAAAASASASGAFGGSGVPEQHHAAMQAAAGGGSLVGDGRAATVGAGAFGGSGVPEKRGAILQASAGGGSLVGDGNAATFGAGAFGGSNVPEQTHVKASAGGGSLVGDGSAATVGAGAFGGSGIPEKKHVKASAGGGSLVGDGKPATFGAGAFGGSNVPEQKHFEASAGGGSLVRDSHGAYSHDMLKAHVHGQGGGVGQGLLHPLPHYLVGFVEWSFVYNMGWTGLEDSLHALENYARADDKIALHNAGEASFTLGHNAYSHMSWQEFRDHFGIGRGMVLSPSDRLDFEARPRGEKVAAPMLRGEALPDEVDWVSKGGVTEVKNQGSCGSCWSFSTTGSMEGAHFIKTGELAVLSEQELVDCDTYDMGCDGGLMDYSFHWIQQNGGICSESDYPYTAEGDDCKKKTCDTVPGTMVDKWIDVDHNSADALKAAVAQQPVSIAIEADEMSFQLYSGGVLTATCGTNLDHGVLLVGYGVSEDGIKYWKVKNSWGADWGADGYILLEREAPEIGGECGILMQASYPVLA